MPTGGGGGGGGATPTITAFSIPYGAAFDFSVGTANQVSIFGFWLPCSLTFSHIATNVHIADAVNNYDLGFYTQAGALVANIGAQTLPSTGIVSFATVQGSKTITAGLYVFGITGNSTTGKIQGSNSYASWVYNVNVAASAGGALPASISAQSTGTSNNSSTFWLF